MADNISTPAPIDTSLAYRKLMEGQSQGQGGTGSTLNIFKDADVLSGLTCKGKGLNWDSTFRPRAQVRPGLFAKLISSMGLNLANINQQLSEINKNNAVQSMPVQEASIDQITGKSHGLGGSSHVAALMAGHHGGGGHEI